MHKSRKGFTLLEIVLVVVIIGVASALLGIRSGNYYYWQDEAAIRRLSDLLVFLHNRAKIDGIFYRMNFDLEDNSYQIFELPAAGQNTANPLEAAAFAQGSIGYLSLELAEFLTPAVARNVDLIAPQSIPSLATKQILPGEMRWLDIKTQRGESSRGSEKPYLLFSPRGFSEFGVIHLKTSSGADVTIVINPFTGTTKIYREYKDFAWSLGAR